MCSLKNGLLLWKYAGRHSKKKRKKDKKMEARSRKLTHTLTDKPTKQKGNAERERRGAGCQSGFN